MNLQSRCILLRNDKASHESITPNFNERRPFVMADQVLKDRRGIVIGRISTASNGIQTLKDSKGIKRGTFDPRTNKTKDSRGITVGTGNLLTTLL